MRQIVNGKVYDIDKLELIYIKQNKQFKELYCFYKDKENPEILLKEHFTSNHQSLTQVIKDNYQMTSLFNDILSKDNKVNIEELELLFNYKILNTNEKERE